MKKFERQSTPDLHSQTMLRPFNKFVYQESTFDSLLESIFCFVQENLQCLDFTARKVRSAHCNHESKQRNATSYESEDIGGKGE
jgi:hypothetical protein